MKRPLFLLCMLFLFATRLVLHFSPPPENLYEIHGGKMLRVTGTVEKKERKGDSRLFCLKACGIAGADPKTRESQWGLICAVDGPEPPIGARVEVYGSIWIYPHATNPGEFDLYSYYLYQGYGARMNVESFRLLSDSYDGWREGLWQLRCECGKLYGSMLSEEDAAVAKAMVLGDRGELSPELKELYRINGISHILAISGVQTLFSTYPFILQAPFYGISRGYISNSYIGDRRYLAKCNPNCRRQGYYNLAKI